MTERKKLLLIALIALLYGPVNASIWGGTAYLGWLTICMGVGIYALIVFRNKGYLLGASLILWLLFGWWFLMIMVLFGPITLMIAAMLPEKKKCPHCKEPIAADATRCPKCTGKIKI